MTSAFQIQEFGFGMHLPEAKLKRVNKFWEEQTPNYILEDSAMKCQGKTFELYFKFGTNMEGYWNFDHMALQFEDCVQV